MTETKMPASLGSAIIPPAIKMVNSCRRTVLSIISACLLSLAVVTISLLDFTKGVALLPLVLLFLLSATVKGKSFGFQKFVFLINIIVLLGTAIFFCFKQFNGFQLFQDIGDNLPYSLNLLGNSLVSAELYFLPLILFFIAKLISTCNLSKINRKNIPKSGAHIFVSIVLIVDLLFLITLGLIGTSLILALDVLYFDYKTFVVCATATVPFIFAIAIILEILNTLRIHTKMRKLKNAFC